MAKAKKPVKKSPAKKAAKKTIKAKTPAKKSAAKVKPKAAKKSAKPAAKKSTKPAPKKQTKSAPKASAKKTAVKQNAKSSAKTSAPAKVGSLMAYKPTPAPKAKIVDLKNFLVPLDDRIIIQVLDEERVTPGGLIIPDTVGDVSGNKRGVVVAVGRGRRDKKGKIHAMDVQTGDRVVFQQYAGNEFDFNNTKLLILRELEVLGILA